MVFEADASEGSRLDRLLILSPRFILLLEPLLEPAVLAE